jgi:hypothetical protein
VAKRAVIRLRGHHLVCLHFFSGEGYGEEFVERLHALVETAEEGGEVEIVPGPDDVCEMCPYLEGGLCRFAKGAEEEIGHMDSSALRLLHLSAGGSADWLEVRKALPRVMRAWKESFCEGCSWQWACARHSLWKEC